MEPSMQVSSRLSRRHFVQTVAGLSVAAPGGSLLAACSRGGRAGLAQPGAASEMIAAPGTSLETTTLRFAAIPGSACSAPEVLADELLRADGFEDVQHLPMHPAEILPTLATGTVDIALHTVGVPSVHADADDSAVILAGVHGGSTNCLHVTAFAR